MNKARWSAVDRYLTDQLVPEAAELEWLLRANAAAGLPPIDVSPPQGKLLNLLIRICGATRALEIGTLGGYSTVWMSRGLPPDGRLVTLESNQRHAEVALANLENAQVRQRVELRVGPALDTLAQLVDENCPPFDFVFVDADKPNNPNYFEWALKLTKRQSVIVFDNVVRDGEVTNTETNDPQVLGARRLNEMLTSDARVSATAIQTVGSKGYDGFAIALVTQ